jgi:hypothetical protein
MLKVIAQKDGRSLEFLQKDLAKKLKPGLKMMALNINCVQSDHRSDHN